CGRRRVPLVLASARVSQRSVDRYRWLGSVIRELFAREVFVGAQGEQDAERFRQLGAAAERTHVTGNVKFDFSVPPETVEKGRAQLVGRRGRQEAERFTQLGAAAERTHVTGNVQFDFSVPPETVEKGRALRELHAPGRPVWIAGSTHGGEEELVLAAHRTVQR